MARTRYFTPQAAIEYGLIDRVVNPQTGGLGAALEKRDYEGELKRSQAGAGRGPQAYAGRD